MSGLSREGGGTLQYMDSVCASQAVSMLGVTMLAQKIDNVVLSPSDAKEFMGNMQAAMQSLMKRAIIGAVLGENPRIASSAGSVQVCNAHFQYSWDRDEPYANSDSILDEGLGVRVWSE